MAPRSGPSAHSISLAEARLMSLNWENECALLRGWGVRLKLLAVISLQLGLSLSENKDNAEKSRSE